jgi:hypothetical protein
MMSMLAIGVCIGISIGAVPAAGEEKPLEELKWPRPIGAPPVEVEEKANGSSKE